MCTLVLFRDVFARYPFVLAANRDELYARATSGPTVLREDPRVVGGRDLEKGGTWMGVSRAGLLAGVTNHRTGRAPDRSRRSRGEIVVEAVASSSIEDAVAYVGSLRATDYNPFNLLIATAERAVVAYARDDEAHIELVEVPPGIHVLPNDRLDAPGWPKVVRAHHDASRVASDRPWSAVSRELRDVLADHRAEPPTATLAAIAAERATGGPAQERWITPEVVRALDALCIHTPVYGTRSASLIALEPGRVAEYWFADGPPCVTPFRDVRGCLDADEAAPE